MAPLFIAGFWEQPALAAARDRWDGVCIMEERVRRKGAGANFCAQLKSGLEPGWRGGEQKC